MRKTLIAFILGLSCVVIIFFVYVLIHNYMDRRGKISHTYENVYTMPYFILDALKINPTISKTDLNVHLKNTMHAWSISSLTFDDEMNILDSWGNKIDILYEIEGDVASITCSSKGPDGIIGTEDDIVNQHKAELNEAIQLSPKSSNEKK